MNTKNGLILWKMKNKLQYLKGLSLENIGPNHEDHIQMFFMVQKNIKT